MEKYLYSDLYELEEKHWWHIAKREASLAILGKVLTKNKIKILDIGCGTGKNVEVLGQLGPTSGIDISEEAIRFCKKRNLKNIYLAGVEKTGFRENYFDLVAMFDVLEHVEEKSSLLESARILKESGYLLVTVPAYMWLWSKWDDVLHHKRRYTKSNLMKVLKENGFKVVFTSYLYPHLVIPVFFIRFLKSKLQSHEYESDFKMSSPFLNQVLLFIARIQIKLMQLIPLPFGTSIICLAQKDER